MAGRPPPEYRLEQRRQRLTLALGVGLPLAVGLRLPGGDQYEFVLGDGHHPHRFDGAALDLHLQAAFDAKQHLCMGMRMAAALRVVAAQHGGVESMRRHGRAA